MNELDFDITTIYSFEKIDFRQRIKLAESNGWIIRSVSVVDGITIATIYRPYQP